MKMKKLLFLALAIVLVIGSLCRKHCGGLKKALTITQHRRLSRTIKVGYPWVRHTGD
jgi:hypothetical protein